MLLAILKTLPVVSTMYLIYVMGYMLGTSLPASRPYPLTDLTTESTTTRPTTAKFFRFEEQFAPALDFDFKSAGSLKPNLTIVIGIPTVKRKNAVYIFDTLASLFKGIENDAANDTGIVIFVGQGDMHYFLELSGKLANIYPNQMANGTLKVLCFSPYERFYPDYLKNGTGSRENVLEKWGDSLQQSLWRTRQAVDYIYLWSVVKGAAEYYLQIEDDIKLKPSWMLTLKRDIESESKNTEWFALSYSWEGLLCKLIRTAKMAPLIQHAVFTFKLKPIDHIYWEYIWNVNCLDKDSEKARNAFELQKYKGGRSLVQHMGKQSSSGLTAAERARL